ncbi:MAG: sporulation protein YabP [Oscillospiraceae bacterium]|nr:sporulation protein YabP [Oscillospiraceae bacterium]
MNEVNNKNSIHNIILEGRKKLSLSGVTDVDSFDENTVLLYTCMGEMTVRGTDLHVNGLSVESGEMNIEGEIKSIVYGDPDRRSPLSLFGKLFR